MQTATIQARLINHVQAKLRPFISSREKSDTSSMIAVKKSRGKAGEHAVGQVDTMQIHEIHSL
jgi:hypothetical protein